MPLTDWATMIQVIAALLAGRRDSARITLHSKSFCGATGASAGLQSHCGECDEADDELLACFEPQRLVGKVPGVPMLRLRQ